LTIFLEYKSLFLRICRGAPWTEEEEDGEN